MQKQLRLLHHLVKLDLGLHMYATNLVLPTSLLGDRSKQTLQRDVANSLNVFVKPSLHLTLEDLVAGILLSLYTLVRDSKDFHASPFS